MIPGGKVRREFCTERAQEALTEYQKSHPPLEPPIKIESIAEWLGFQVVLLYTVGEEFSGLVSIPQRLMGVNGRHHHHRRRFTIGHELAHILLKHPPESHSSPKEVVLYNAEADECAAELLMPTPMLRQQLVTTKSIATLANSFDVSKEAMQVKLKTINSQPIGPG